MKHPAFCWLAALALILPLSGCVAQRTVTSGGRTVSQGPVVKRPIQGLVQRSRQ